MLQIAHNLKRLRKSKGETQLSLSSKLGLSKNHIAMIEQNKANPSIKQLEEIARILDVPVKEFFRDIP